MDTAARGMRAAWTAGLGAEVAPYVRIGMPLLVSQILQMLMGLTDTLMAGRAGSLQLAGVAAGTGTWFPLALGVIGILFVVPAMVSNQNAAGQHEEVAETTRQAAWLSLLAGLIIATLPLTAIPAIYEIVNVQEQTREIALRYTLMLGLSAPFLALSVVMRCYSEGLGYTMPVTVITLIAAIVNVPLNWIFIYGKFGMPELGGVGCGVASGIVNFLSMVMILGYTHWHPRYAPTRVWTRITPPNWPRMKEILLLGLPVGATLMIEISMFGGATVLMASLPPVITAGHQIALQLASLAFMIPLSVGLTATIRVGHHLGARRPDSAMHASAFALVLTFFFAIFNASVMLLGRDWLPTPFTTEPSVVRMASYLLVYAAAFQVFDGLQGAAMGSLRGYKDTFVPSLYVALCYWGLGLPLGIVLAFDAGAVDWMRWLLGRAATAQPLGAKGLWIAMNVSLFAVTLLLLSRLKAVARRHLDALPGTPEPGVYLRPPPPPPEKAA